MTGLLIVSMGFSCTLWKAVASAQKAGQKRPNFRFSETFRRKQPVGNQERWVLARI